jgi:hypothetical protein
LRRRGKTENIRTVTLEDAWRELGVDPGADGDGVRRAYLRLIKTRKPESDPVGFQRAREAFEIARAGSEIEAIAAFGGRRRASVFARPPGATGAPAPDAAPAPTAAPPPAAGTPGATTAADVPPSRSGRPGVPDLILPDAGQSRADIIFDGFSSAWHSVPASADQRKRLEIAREAVAVLPDDPRAHWMLVTTLSRLGPDAALADALRAGWNAGWPDFLEALLVRLPARATREEIDAGFASPRPELQLAAAAASANWNAPRAAALVVDLCRSAMDASLGARDDRVRDLPVSRMLDLILALHGAGALDAATDAQKALRDCLHDSGLEIALMHGPLGGVWTLAEEIGGLPRDFPQGLRTAFASATRSGDLSSAFIDSCRAVERDRSGVRLWSDKLTATAPNVSAILRGAPVSRSRGCRTCWSRCCWRSAGCARRRSMSRTTRGLSSRTRGARTTRPRRRRCRCSAPAPRASASRCCPRPPTICAARTGRGTDSWSARTSRRSSRRSRGACAGTFLAASRRSGGR